MDARQWCDKSSNFGKVNFGHSWGLWSYSYSSFYNGVVTTNQKPFSYTQVALEIMLMIVESSEYPYLATSSAKIGIVNLTNDGFSVVEVKCPHKHHDNTIRDGSILLIL